MKTLVWQNGYGDGILGSGENLQDAVDVANSFLDPEITAEECVPANSRAGDGDVVYQEVSDEIAAEAEQGGWKWLQKI